MLTLFLRINEEEKVEDSEELSHPVSISYNNGKANIFKLFKLCYNLPNQRFYYTNSGKSENLD